MGAEDQFVEVNALRVTQWLDQWTHVEYDETRNQAMPKRDFFIFSMSATKLKKLAGIYRRSTDRVAPRKEDLAIQRRHDPARSAEIKHYVRGGYPWSALSDAKREDPANKILRRPGWLPTAVVVNLLTPGSTRSGKQAEVSDVVELVDRSEVIKDLVTLKFPNYDSEASEDRVAPIEIIDGQHRLFAFDETDEETEDYQLPVVAFHGLDLSWQAYLFWMINIKPKRINPSLAFDLYPLLRDQQWLEQGDRVHVYRESRAQELTEILWLTPDNPWYRRINMLGGDKKKNGPVTQAAFVRSLTNSMVKPWNNARKRTGGIFGGSPDDASGLSWTRVQQAAFLVISWKLLADAIEKYKGTWAEALRESPLRGNQLELDIQNQVYSDPAFVGKDSLLASDQGVRGFQSVVNDMCFELRDDLALTNWKDDSGSGEVNPTSVEEMMQGLIKQPVYSFLERLCDALAEFDWRSSSAEGLSEEDKQRKAALRGSGGYSEIRKQLLTHLAKVEDDQLSNTASSLIEVASQ